jgi:NAD(P)H-hydrate epimerase
MQPIVSGEQMRKWDSATIQIENISTFDLMDKATDALFKWVKNSVNIYNQHILLVCGSGNNGGDGYSLALKLANAGFRVKVWVVAPPKSSDCITNAGMVELTNTIERIVYPDSPVVQENTVVIDAMLGSGLKGALNEPYATAIHTLNGFPGIKIAIDLPSGMSSDDLVDGIVFKADYTLTFQALKPTFIMAETFSHLGEVITLDIGLEQHFREKESFDLQLVEIQDVSKKIINPNKFTHKGNQGHGLLIVGGVGKMGAAILSSEACLRSGCGKLTAHVPETGYSIMQTALPEAMVSVDPHKYCWSESPQIESFDALGIGCGVGLNKLSQNAFRDLLQKIKIPLVLDADALNILSSNPDMWENIPPLTILTPHPGEFFRLIGHKVNGLEAIDSMRTLCQKYQIIIILKGAYTRICYPDGKVLINNTGNPGMATAGSGDVLTGILVGLLAQGYSPQNAAMVGCYIHGLAGDLALKKIGSPESIIAGDITNQLGHAFEVVKGIR